MLGVLVLAALATAEAFAPALTAGPLCACRCVRCAASHGCLCRVACLCHVRGLRARRRGRPDRGGRLVHRRAQARRDYGCRVRP